MSPCSTCFGTGQCPRCDAVPVAVAQQRAELEGLRATVRAIEAVAVIEADLVIRRMCRAALEGRYPDARRAA